MGGNELEVSEDSSGQNVADLFQTLVFAVKKGTALQSHMFKKVVLTRVLCEEGKQHCIRANYTISLDIYFA